MRANPYLHFDGNCEAAFKFYEQNLGGKIVAMMRFESAPEGMPITPESRKQIMHARMDIGDTVLMASDAPGGRYQKPQGFSISLAVDSAEDAERKFAALSENGAVTMPMAETFFAIRWGMATDQFGIPWMVICERPMP